MTIHRAGIVLVLAVGLVGCAAREPARTEEPAPANAGGESASLAASPDAEFADDRPYEGGGSAGGAGEAGPPEEYEDPENLDPITAYDALRSTETYFDELLDNGSSNCPEAERLVRDICYLAERVCGLDGVETDPDDTHAAARCDEGRARCARSEARLARSCP